MAKILEVIEGNLGRSQQLRKTANGQGVMNFSIVATPRRKQGDNWVDDESIWTECTLWGKAAESFAESIASGVVKPGTPLIGVGQRKARRADSYVNKDGQTVPERVEQSVSLESIGVQITPYTLITGIGKPSGVGAPAGGSAPAGNANEQIFDQTAAPAATEGDIFGSGSAPAAGGDIFGDF